MSRSNYIYNSFIGGEVSPKFFGRTDTQQYNSCCEEIKNCVVHPQGGTSRRTGTRFAAQFVKESGFSPTQTRLIPFYGSDGTRWQLIIIDDDPTGADPWRVINVDTKVVQEIDILLDSGSSFADPNLDGIWDMTYTTGKGVDLNELQFAQSGDTIIISHSKIRPIKITYNSLNDPDEQFFMMGAVDPRVPANGTIGSLRFKQNPYILSIDSDITVSWSGSNATIVIVAGDKEFTLGHVGQYMRFNAGSHSAVIFITGWTDATTVFGLITDGDFFDTTPITFGDGGETNSSWEESSWSDARGWPKSVCFFESRLVFGGTTDSPDSEWFSQTNDIEEFDARGLEQDPEFGDPVVATDPFEATLKSVLLNEIRWMVPGKTIVTGTNSSEFIVQGPDPQASIGPTNIQTQSETPYGSAYVQAIRSDNTTLFLCRDRRSFREMIFNFNEDSFEANNLSLIAEHMSQRSTFSRRGDFFARPSGGIRAFAKQQIPDGIVWCIDVNGALIGMTRERKQSVVAWHYHELAGDSFTSFEVPGNNIAFKPFIQSISSVQISAVETDGSGGEPDEIWMAVRRGVRVDDATDEYRIFTHIEVLSQEWDRAGIENDWIMDEEPKRAPIYMDCAYLFSSTDDDYNDDGVIANHPYGFSQEVTVIIDGYFRGEINVGDDGTLDISSLLTQAQIDGDTTWQAIFGFNFLAYVVPVVPEVPAQTGSSQGQMRRIDQISIHFYRAIGCKFGRKTSTEEGSTPASSLEEVVFPPGVNSGDPIPMYTGMKTLNFPQGYERRPQVYIESHLPFPMSITHVVARMVVYEG